MQAICTPCNADRRPASRACGRCVRGPDSFRKSRSRSLRRSSSGVRTSPGAERMMQEQNGVPIAGHFPDIPFPACCNVVGRNPLQFDVANEVWSLGAAGTQVLFNGGLTSAQVDVAKRRRLSSDSAHGLPVGRGSARPGPYSPQQLVMQQRGKGRAHRGRRLLEPVQGRLRWRSRL